MCTKSFAVGAPSNGCIEGEMAVTAEDKLKVATNSYELLTRKYGIPEEDIIFDDALLYAVEVHQRNTKDDQGADKTSFTDLIIKQEITEDDNSEKNINFLINQIHSEIF